MVSAFDTSMLSNGADGIVPGCGDHCAASREWSSRPLLARAFESPSSFRVK
jgi:hypothetical protein